MQQIIWFIKNHSLLVIGWFFSFALLVFFIIKEKFSKMKFICHDEVIYNINKKNAIILDIRSNKEYNNGHISNSINLLIDEEKNNNFKKLEKYKIKKLPIILVCSTGENFETINFAKNLYNLGFKKVLILKSGILGWCRENLPLIITNKK